MRSHQIKTKICRIYLIHSLSPPLQINPLSESIKPKGCAIQSVQILFQCGHLLCQSCSEQTINQRHQCPFCRNRVSRAEVYKIFDA